MTALQSEPVRLMAAPIGPKNGNSPPPEKPEPGGDEALPAPHIHEVEDSTPPVIKIEANDKPPRKSGTSNFVFPPLPASLIDAVAEGAIQVVPAIQQKLLAEGVIAAPIIPDPMVLPEKTAAADSIGCKVEIRIGLHAEPKGPPSFAHFDCDLSGRFCRLVRIWLNTSNAAMRPCLAKRNVRGAKFFAAAALSRCLVHSAQSALTEVLLAEIRTGLAPNEQISKGALTQALVESTLLEPIERLPVFGSAFTDAVGRSFRLAELDLAIPTADLGAPWDRSPEGRR